MLLIKTDMADNIFYYYLEQDNYEVDYIFQEDFNGEKINFRNS